MAGKTCQICGKPSGIYPLCKEHLQLKNEGKVVKNESGSWVLVSEEETIESKCVICSNPSNGKTLCPDCYKESVERKDEFDKNQNHLNLRITILIYAQIFIESRILNM